MVTFVKLGGSLITDKHIQSSFRENVVKRLVDEIRQATRINPQLSLLIGHGSGAFGHYIAQRYDTINGVFTEEQWMGFSEVAAAAAELNHLVARVFRDASLPVWRIQPSASAVCCNGVLQTLAIQPIEHALAHRLIPLIYGDVSLDTQRGGTIVSTEQLFFYLAHQLPVTRILLLGEVAGVYDSQRQVIPQITPRSFPAIIPYLMGASGVDVTGGMAAKVQSMVNLVEALPHIQIHILDGREPDLLRDALTSSIIKTGTTIQAV